MSDVFDSALRRQDVHDAALRLQLVRARLCAEAGELAAVTSLRHQTVETFMPAHRVNEGLVAPGRLRVSMRTVRYDVARLLDALGCGPGSPPASATPRSSSGLVAAKCKKFGRRSDR